MSKGWAVQKQLLSCNHPLTGNLAAKHYAVNRG
jgi:hypothetical protein